LVVEDVLLLDSLGNLVAKKRTGHFGRWWSYKSGNLISVAREQLKSMVAINQIRLV
jgi:hypothetical protein